MNTLERIAQSFEPGYWSVDRWLDQAGPWPAWVGHVEGGESTAVLPIDVVEVDGSLVVKASMPGVAPENVEVTLEDKVLTIKGTVESSAESEDAKIYRQERRTGSFSRSLRLGENLDASKIAAEVKNGLVTVTIPRVPEESPKMIRIPVQTHSEEANS